MIGKVDAYDLQAAIAEGIQSNATLAALVTTLFGAGVTQTVYSGFDTKDPPKSNKLPWVAVAMSNNNISGDWTTVEYSYFIGGAVLMPQTTTDVGGVVTYTGMKKLYDYSEGVRDALIAVLEATSAEKGYDILSMSAIEYETDFPYGNFYLTVTVAVELA